ncbi:MAG: lysA, partial [Paenibacillus sp.]|nr:lysA [Paenibacillus sp.]
NHYNRIRKPAVIFVQDGKSDVVVRRDTYADIAGNDIIPQRMQKQTVAVKSGE